MTALATTAPPERRYRDAVPCCCVRVHPSNWLVGCHPKNWQYRDAVRCCCVRVHPSNWLSGAIPSTGGRPTQELAGTGLMSDERLRACVPPVFVSCF
jgi:hypothetical protein